MKAIMRTLAVVAATLQLIAATSCFSALSLTDAQAGNNDNVDGSPGSVSITFGGSRSAPEAPSGARTVTADFARNVAEWTVTLSRADGAIRTVTTTAPAVTVNGLVPGSWDIAVTGRTGAGTSLFSGSVSGIAVTASGTVAVTVPVTSVQTGNGTMRLTVTVPYATWIGSATASVDSGSAVPVAPTVTVNVDDVALTRTIVFEASLTPGAHVLSFSLYRGVAMDVPAGTFLEAVSIYSGVVSDQWITPKGILVDILALGWGDLVNTDRQLSNLTGGALGHFAGVSGFNPNQNEQDYLLNGDPPVTFIPFGAVSGQTISYRLTDPSTPGTWTGAISEVAIGDTRSNGDSIWFRVEPIGHPERANVYRINVFDVYHVTYHSNGETVPVEGSFSEAFGAPPHTVWGYLATGMTVETISGSPGTFIGWNTARDGSGIPYATGNALAVSARTELYAQWEKPAVTAALAGIAAQLALGNGNVAIPADFTVNDLYSLAALIAATTTNVTLDMSLATAITAIPASTFNGCARLVAVSVPSTITAIGANAFAGTGMVLYGTEGFDFICNAMIPPDLGLNAFGPDPVNVFNVHVPAAALDVYKANPDWNFLDLHINPP